MTLRLGTKNGRDDQAPSTFNNRAWPMRARHLLQQCPAQARQAPLTTASGSCTPGTFNNCYRCVCSRQLLTTAPGTCAPGTFNKYARRTCARQFLYVQVLQRVCTSQSARQPARPARQAARQLMQPDTPSCRGGFPTTHCFFINGPEHYTDV